MVQQATLWHVHRGLQATLGASFRYSEARPLSCSAPVFHTSVRKTELRPGWSRAGREVVLMYLQSSGMGSEYQAQVDVLFVMQVC